MARKVTDSVLRGMSLLDVFKAVAKGEAANDDFEHFVALQSAGTIAMSDKGCVTLKTLRRPYGLSLYPNEWKAVFDAAAPIQAFIADNIAELQKRGEASKAAKAAERAAEKAKPVAVA